MQRFENLNKTLIIISGISSSGKTTYAKKINELYNYEILSLDDYKEYYYEKYGFVSEIERKNLWNLAKKTYIAEIIANCRQNKTIIVEYPFDTSWQVVFYYIKNEYNYDIYIINCNSRNFDDIWNSREDRDSICIDRPKCLTASKYIKGVLYENNGKLNEEYKEKKRMEYINNKYTSLNGDYVISDSKIDFGTKLK